MQDRLYKYVNEKDIRMSPKYFVEDGKVYTNPSKEMQIAHGYDREFVKTPYPPTDEGFTRDYTYTDTNPIQLVWSEPIPIEVGENEWII